MNTFAQRVARFLISEDGPTAVEYAVMVALIIVASLVAIGTLSTKVQKAFTDSAAAIP